MHALAPDSRTASLLGERVAQQHAGLTAHQHALEPLAADGPDRPRSGLELALHVLDDADVSQAQSLVDVALELVRHTLRPHSDDGEATLYGLGCQHGAGRDRVDDDEDVAVGRCAACGDPLDRVGHSISHSTGRGRGCCLRSASRHRIAAAAGS
eukprot:scaffold73319_cov72-Phaeocystis_antarctica.AAC.4